MTYNNEIKFFNRAFYYALFNSKLEHNTGKGIYLICFRKLEKNSYRIVYNYIYYPDIFIKSLLFYLINKQYHKNTLQYEYGEHLTIIDNSFITKKDDNYDDNDDYKTILSKDNRLLYWREEFLNNPELKPSSATDWQTHFDINLKKMSVVVEKNNLSDLINLAINKNYPKFGGNLIENSPLNLTWLKKVDDIYILKDCLFVVEDKDLLIKNLRERYSHLTLIRAISDYKDTFNSISSFLSVLDAEYRNSLYQHHSLDPNLRDSSNKPILGRHFFSFKKVHMKIGNIAYFSTLTKKY